MHLPPDNVAPPPTAAWGANATSATVEAPAATATAVASGTFDACGKNRGACAPVGVEPPHETVPRTQTPDREPARPVRDRADPRRRGRRVQRDRPRPPDRCMLLAYVASRFVLEVVLGRTT